MYLLLVVVEAVFCPWHNRHDWLGATYRLPAYLSSFSRVVCDIVARPCPYSLTLCTTLECGYSRKTWNCSVLFSASAFVSRLTGLSCTSVLLFSCIVCRSTEWIARLLRWFIPFFLLPFGVDIINIFINQIQCYLCVSCMPPAIRSFLVERWAWNL